MLAFGLLASNHRDEKNPCGKKRCRYPQKRQLNVPRARNIKRKNASQIKAKEIGNFRAVVLRGTTEQGLDQKKSGHN